MFLIFWAVIGGAIGYTASGRQGFSPVWGVIGGVLLGPLAVLMFAVDGVASVSDANKKCPRCSEWVKRDAVVCKHCHSELEAIKIAA